MNRGEFPDLSGDGGRIARRISSSSPRRTRATTPGVSSWTWRSGACPVEYGLDPLADIQVLTPMHRGPIGAGQLNAALQAALNPPRNRGQPSCCAAGGSSASGTGCFSSGTTTIKGVYNGDLGRITAIDPDRADGRWCTMDEREVSYDFSDLDELALAYAVTVHKSQGSGVPVRHPARCIPRTISMLQRNLLYTAITRAKRLLVLVGTREGPGHRRPRTTPRAGAIPGLQERAGMSPEPRRTTALVDATGCS
ncbi:MAG: ATP-binding domain-containing protein [Rhodopseudomonas palustris]|nr:ATP-binding domain-containing protein [Rhodopseudomonas palustris]